EPLGPQLLELLAVLALAAADERRQDHEARSVPELQHLVDDLLGRLAADRAAADVAVRMSDPGPEQPQIVVDLGHRPDRGARVAGGRLLIDRDGRRQALDRVDVRLVHLAEELALSRSSSPAPAASSSPTAASSAKSRSRSSAGASATGGLSSRGGSGASSSRSAEMALTPASAGRIPNSSPSRSTPRRSRLSTA